MSEVEKPKGYGNKSFFAAMLMVLAAAGLYLYATGPFIPKVTSKTASLLFDGEAMATFEKSDAGELQTGMLASTEIEGFGKRIFPGVIKMIHKDDDGGTSALVRLLDPPMDVSPPVPCKVTVKLVKKEEPLP